MQLRNDFVAVAVPATTANMGPGFDSLGMALDLFDEVSVHAHTGATSVVVEGEGKGAVELGEDNLVVQALRVGLEAVGAPQTGVRMHCTNRIPHGRGLGSSAAAIVAGLMLARALVGDSEALPDQHLLDLATGMEGHPDNVAPAILGGATVSWTEGERAGALRLTPPELIEPVAFIPGFQLSTELARRAIPEAVPHADGVFNASRAALLAAFLANAPATALLAPTAAVEGEEDEWHRLLMAATEDRLHQEYRRGAMEPSLALVDWLREAGYAAVVSGAGPTVLSLEPVPAHVREQAREAGWDVRTLAVARTGARIVRGGIARTPR